MKVNTDEFLSISSTEEERIYLNIEDFISIAKSYYHYNDVCQNHKQDPSLVYKDENTKQISYGKKIIVDKMLTEVMLLDASTTYSKNNTTKNKMGSEILRKILSIPQTTDLTNPATIIATKRTIKGLKNIYYEIFTRTDIDDSSIKNYNTTFHIWNSSYTDQDIRTEIETLKRVMIFSKITITDVDGTYIIDNWKD